MRRRLASVAVLTLMLSGVVPIVSAEATEPAGRYVVVLRGSVPDSAAVATDHARRFGLSLTHIYRYAVKGYSATIPTAALARLESDPRVDFVSPDTSFAAADSSSSTQLLPTGIDRIDGERSSTRAGDGRGAVDVDVAVLDSGISVTHPDLNVAGGVNCRSKGASYDDDNGHGTHVAGTIGALDNGFGVVGVAPGARLWAVKVLGANGSGNTADVLCGIDWIAAHASTIEVANMSLGGKGSDDGHCGATNKDAIHAAICRAVSAGVTVVVAAGNSASDAAGFSPASYDEVITVSALADYDGKPGGLATPSCNGTPYVTPDDTLAGFSNYGADIDLIAPGMCIHSTLPGGYGNESGTSMASPHAAGAAALYKAGHPSATPAAVQAALVAAGTSDWNATTDPDGIQEPLLNVGSL